MKVSPARLTWTQEGVPFSLDFDDVYFSTTHGLEESNYVFVQANRLPSRFEAVNEHDTFLIGDIGFGSGLNLLSTVRCWQSSKAQGQLHYISIEKHPLKKADLVRALKCWPELSSISQALIDNYPSSFQTGTYVFAITQQITLTLIINDVKAALKDLHASYNPAHLYPQWQGVDAWFLDGFTPAKNPEMWQIDVFESIANLSKPKATLSSFSSARIVRDGLTHSGFDVVKQSGYGLKREMITARVDTARVDTAKLGSAQRDNSSNTPPLERKKSHKSDYPAQWMVIENYHPLTTDKKVAVIGGGLAGCHSARALAEKGYHVTLFEKSQALCQGASGNPQAALYAKLSNDGQALSEFNRHSLLFAQRFYKPYWQQKNLALGEACGLLQMAYSDAVEQSLKTLSSLLPKDFAEFVTRDKARQLANVDLNYGGLCFKDSGWLNPKILCEQLVSHTNIDCQFNTQIDLLKYDAHWQLNSEDQVYSADAVVIAQAFDAVQFVQTQWMPINALRGQVSSVNLGCPSPLSTVLCAKGYIAPSINNYLSFGATYTPKVKSIEITSKEHIDNRNKIADISTELFDVIDEKITSATGRVGFRATTRDYLPIVGPVACEATTKTRYAELSRNAKAPINCANRYHPHLYVNTGHGSRGLCYTPLSAAIVANLVAGHPPPVAQSIIHSLNPSRFLIRDLIRQHAK